MSTLKVTNIESPSGGGVNAKITDINGGQLSNRNLIINGDQRIDQRNNGSAVTTTSSFPVDRFTISHSSNGAFSAQRSTEAPTGFQYSTKFTTTTADTNITGSQRLLYFTKIEGQNAQHLEFGTANAKSVTLSFWVRSSVTGTFSGSLQNGAQNRSYPYDYTISSADTWEHKTITISGDTTGTWATDNTKSHQIFWSLGISSDYSAPANAWVGAQRWGSTSGTANTLGTLNATWYITGVQLEVGEVATAFEHRSVGDELHRCKRYFERKSYTGAQYQVITAGVVTGTSTSTNLLGIVYHEVEKRTNPTITSSAAGTFRNNAAGKNDETATSISFSMLGVHNFQIVSGSATAKNAGAAGYISRENFESTVIDIDAEL